ncbi:MAG: hypothetical protein BroJett025_10410 [Patescibacteria group bacterium]|nr:MAG: hypothetical protein BroJett025_10410 [Patescibacteria group bacterium]
MENILGANSFITWHPPKKVVTVGNIKVSAGNGAIINTKTTNSSGQSLWPTVSLEYENLPQGQLSLWVLFHAFIIGDPWTLPSYMGTIDGIVEYMGKPFGSERDYSDILNTVYRTEGIREKMSYEQLYSRFILLSEQQSGMVKNLLLDLKPGQQWSHSEMADYSYWRMVIDFSIVEAIVGRQPFCEGIHDCSKCNRTGILHNPLSAQEWTKGRLLEIIGDEEKIDQYMKIIWTVRQNIRHKTAHESDYPHQRPESRLQPGDNQFDVETVINSFKTDAHALTALEQNMHEVTRILLLNNVLQTKVFPDIRPYMVRSGGMSWEEFSKLFKLEP